jgi:hypothetical protein
MDTKQDTREVKFTSKLLSEFGGPIEVTATFTHDEDGFPEDPRLMVGNLDIGFFIEKNYLKVLDIEARDALYAELKADSQAHAETRAECRRDDAKSDVTIYAKFRMEPAYQATPTPAQCDDFDEMGGIREEMAGAA